MSDENNFVGHGLGFGVVKSGKVEVRGNTTNSFLQAVDKNFGYLGFQKFLCYYLFRYSLSLIQIEWIIHFYT